jgi:hypothetical protein
MSRRRANAEERERVRERAGGLCEYCKSPEDISSSAFSVDHVSPWSRGGKTALENFALACLDCNNFKHDKTKVTDPQTGDEVALFNPRSQRWQDHFAWNYDTTRVVGLTTAGRATVAALKLNRSRLVRQRGFLFQVGEHPPEMEDGD